MQLKEMQCIKEKANILSLPILPYNKFQINETINIFKKLISYLNLNNYVLNNKIVIIKRDWLMV